MKRVALFAVLAGLMAPVALSGCGLTDYIAQRAAIAKADFKFDHVALTSADIPFVTPDAKANLQVVLNVTNPNPVTARLDRLDYTLLMEGSQVGAGATSEDFAVDPGATKPLTLSLAIPYLGLPQLVIDALQKRQATFTLNGTSHLKATIAGVDIPLDYPVSLTQTESF
jgi:LEA14-like dessication related protein